MANTHLSLLNAQLTLQTAVYNAAQADMDANILATKKIQDTLNAYISNPANKCSGAFSSSSLNSCLDGVCNQLPCLRSDSAETKYARGLLKQRDDIIALRPAIQARIDKSKQTLDSINTQIKADPDYQAAQAIAIQDATNASRQTTIKYIVIGTIVILISILAYKHFSK